MSIRHDLFLAKEWFLAHRALGVKTNWKELSFIREFYNLPERHYHTWQHIYETIGFARRNYGFQPLVVLALFYHDVIYRVSSKGSEEDSAAVWESFAQYDEYSDEDIQKVSEMIRMTAHHHPDPTGDPLFHMMNDADMSIFTTYGPRYLKYARDIWLEYSSVGQETYIRERLKFLNGLDPSSLFYTPEARKLLWLAEKNIELEKFILTNEPSTLAY